MLQTARSKARSMLPGLFPEEHKKLYAQELKLACDPKIFNTLSPAEKMLIRSRAYSKAVTRVRKNHLDVYRTLYDQLVREGYRRTDRRYRAKVND